MSARKLLLLLLTLSACTREKPLTLAPEEATLLPGMVQPLHVDGLSSEDAVWEATDGARVQPTAEGALVTAPAAGTYTVTVKSRSAPGRMAQATLTVRSATPAAFTLEAAPVAGGVAGASGDVRFDASPVGETGARARFALAGQALTRAQSATGGEGELEVEILDAAHGRITYAGHTLDGEGALSSEEEAALRALAAGPLFPALALAPLDLGCQGDRPVEPRVMAALLMPWQAVLKYLTPDRAAQAEALASVSRCRYFTPLSPEPIDSRPTPLLPVLSNGRTVPAAFGYLPFDTEGAVASVDGAGQGLTAASGPIGPDSNVFGPGASMCRGACGADCEKNNCGDPKEEWRCEQKDGQNTGRKERWESYTCGEHEGCREHDACFDQCNATFGVDAWDAFFCMRGCDMQAAQGYGAGQGLEWAQGHGPYDREKTYDYKVGDPVEDLQMCPPGMRLAAVPSAGQAPLATVLRWSGVPQTGGTPRCRLDPGDGSPPYTIDPCLESGEQAHTYVVPSELRKAEGVYTATLQMVGTEAHASTDVQPTWRFEATPTTGKPPLAVDFRWEGLPTTGANVLTCTLDFGDGAASETVQDCAHATSAAHTYQAQGTYVARLTVTGERTVSRSLVIEVKEEEALLGLTVSGGMDGHFPAQVSSTPDVLQWDVETLPDSPVVVNVHLEFKDKPAPGTYTCSDLAFASWGASGTGDEMWDAGCPPHPHAANITVVVTSVEDTQDGWYTLHGTATADPTVFNFPDGTPPIVIKAVF